MVMSCVLAVMVWCRKERVRYSTYSMCAVPSRKCGLSLGHLSRGRR